MAIFKSQVMTQASGSVGGLTYTRANGGLVMRARAVPTNPNTARQVAARSAFAEAITYWTEQTTPAFRNSWDVYAKGTPVTNRLGDSIVLSGQNMFARYYSVRALVANQFSQAAPIVPFAPIIQDRGTFTTPVISQASAIAGLEISLPGTTATPVDAWAEEQGSMMLVFQGKPCNPTRNYFRGPYRLIAIQNGVTPPVTEITVSAAEITARGYTFQQGHCINMAVAVLRGDGRYSARRSLAAVIAS